MAQGLRIIDMECNVPYGAEHEQKRAAAAAVPPAAGTEEQRRPGAGHRQRGPPGSQPGAEGALGGRAVRDGALLAALAQHPDDAALVVEVVDVEAAELADADAGRVEQLEHRDVAQPHRAAVVGPGGRRLEQGSPRNTAARP